MVNLLRPGEGDRRGGPGRVPSLDEEARRRLLRRLGELQQWWATAGEGVAAARRLRAPALEPDLEEEPTLAALEQALGEIAAARRAALPPGPLVPPRRRGRLVVCELAISIADGVAEAASQGFFDVEDRPPWETWLLAFGHARPSQPDQPIECLLAWVPPEWEDRADAGIRASAVGCLYWLDWGDWLEGDAAEAASGPGRGAR